MPSICSVLYYYYHRLVSDIAVFVPKRDVKLKPTYYRRFTCPFYIGQQNPPVELQGGNFVGAKFYCPHPLLTVTDAFGLGEDARVLLDDVTCTVSVPRC